jgi:hypothetical protein
VKSIEKIADFTLNLNVSLRLGGNLAMVHVSPFLLILL